MPIQATHNRKSATATQSIYEVKLCGQLVSLNFFSLQEN